MNGQISRDALLHTETYNLDEGVRDESRELFPHEEVESLLCFVLQDGIDRWSRGVLCEFMVLHRFQRFSHRVGVLDRAHGFQCIEVVD